MHIYQKSQGIHWMSKSPNHQLLLLSNSPPSPIERGTCGDIGSTMAVRRLRQLMAGGFRMS